MKPFSLPWDIGRAIVAPRTGAWIETHYCRIKNQLKLVAPRTGAWIETITLFSISTIIAVAPRTGAWIETNIWCNKFLDRWSPPARGRGLKPY